MGDRDLRAAERAWRALPNEPERISQALAEFGRLGEVPPWDLLAVSPRWRSLTQFVRKWFARPLEAGDGCQASELAAAEARLGRRLPDRLREWFTLAGRREEFPGLRGESAWSFSTLMGLHELAVDSRGWLSLAWGHQGIGNWGIRLDSEGGLGETVLFRPEPGQVVQVGAIEDFYLSFLVEELAWNGAHGCGPEVRHGVYWNVEEVTAAARSPYATLPLISLNGVDAPPGPDLLGDEETYVCFVDPEPVYVMTCTREAWRRANDLFGDPQGV